MVDIRMIVSWGQGTEFNDTWMSNTLYFAVDTPSPIDPPDYQTLANDLSLIYQAQGWTSGCKIEVRAYNMADPKPRPERAYSTRSNSGGGLSGPHQVALCLSYYSERNLPRQRGRIYIGPWAAPPRVPTQANIDSLRAFGQALAGLGGVNVDWSVYSPTKASLGEDPTMSISNIWIDNSWDIIRSRKEPATTRTSLAINE